jgi:hypothetical protein
MELGRLGTLRAKTGQGGCSDLVFCPTSQMSLTCRFVLVRLAGGREMRPLIPNFGGCEAEAVVVRP